MRRIAMALGTLPIAGLLTVSIPAAAHAANGKLIINGKKYNNPSGCYNSDRRPLHVINHTNETAFMFVAPDCKGYERAALNPLIRVSV